MRQPPNLSEIPRYPVVAGTALLAIGVTLAWWSKADVSPLFENAMIRRGQLWRLVTSMLPHGGVLHLAFNIYWLWVFGTILEEIYGHFRTALLILFFAAGSGAMEFAFLSGGVGLSGVGYGLFGLLWVLATNDQRFHGAIDRRTVELFVVWFFFCIIATVTKIMPIANIAHGAGAILGILTGLAISRPERRLAMTTAALAIFLFGVWAATLGRPHVNLSQSEGSEEVQWGFEAVRANRNQEAVKWLRDAVTYQPHNQAYWFSLALAYHSVGNQPATLNALHTAATLGDPDAASYLGAIYDRGLDGVPKNEKEAVYWYRKAAASNDPDALNNLAWAYATSSDPEIRNPLAALELAKKAVALQKNEPDPNCLDTLAEAYYTNGFYKEAVETERKALAETQDSPKDDFQKHLQKYELALQKRTPVSMKR